MVDGRSNIFTCDWTVTELLLPQPIDSAQLHRVGAGRVESNGRDQCAVFVRRREPILIERPTALLYQGFRVRAAPGLQNPQNQRRCEIEVSTVLFVPKTKPPLP